MPLPKGMLLGSNQGERNCYTQTDLYYYPDEYYIVIMSNPSAAGRLYSVQNQIIASRINY